MSAFSDKEITMVVLAADKQYGDHKELFERILEKCKHFRSRQVLAGILVAITLDRAVLNVIENELLAEEDDDDDDDEDGRLN